MALPLLATGIGARVAVGNGARTATSRSAARGIQDPRMIVRDGMRPGLQSSIQNKIQNKRFQQSDQLDREDEAQVVNRSPYIQNVRAIGSADSRYPTIAENLQTKTANYSSVERTRDARLEENKQSKKKEELGSATSLPQNLNQPATRGIGKTGKLAVKTKEVIQVTAKMARTALIISMVAFPLWLTLQVPAWAVGMLGLGSEAAIDAGLEWIPIVGGFTSILVSYVIPGYELFGFSWGLNTIIGLCTLGATAVLLTAFGVPWHRGKWSMIGLCAAIVLYCSPVLQMLPWVYLFLFMVWISRVSEPA